MSPQAQLVMLAWIPIVLYFFTRFPAQRAVVISFIVAWLFLPQRAGFSLTGLPDYERMSATCYGILLATVIYDAQRFSIFKLGWLDLPMLIWCLCPFASSISNGLGAYDGISAVLSQTVSYGVPYFLGRIYLNNLAGLRNLAIGIFIGGLVYVPLCLYEIRMSPQLHNIVYGYLGNPSFAQTIRYDGYRPTVFMRHGLSVGMWIMAATLIGIWLWKAGIIKQLWGIQIKWLVAALLITFVLIKSTGAYFLLVLGIAILFTAWQFRTAILLFFLIGSMSFYLAQNALTETYITDQIIASLDGVVPEERIGSLEFRFNNEELLADKARERIVFGWGGWGRNRVYDYNWAGELVDISVTDSLWIIAFGANGLVGLIAVFGSSLLPALSFVLSRYPARSWFNPKVAPAAVLVVVITLYMLDCALNNQPNPVFTLASGGIAGLVLKEPESNKLKSGLSVAPLSLHQRRSNQYY